MHGIKSNSFEVDSLSTGVLEQHYEGRTIYMHSIELCPINSSLLPYPFILLHALPTILTLSVAS